jgi:hypothetical protein
MAFHSDDGPNMIIVRFVMDNIWSVAQLEAYITTYQPGPPPLHVLRTLLGHGRIAPPAYARCLARLASILFGLGHIKPVYVVVAEMLQRIPPGLLTAQQVRRLSGSSSLTRLLPYPIACTQRIRALSI